MVYEIFKKTIEDYGLIEKKDKLLLGVSGGPDSICLLYLFAKLRESFKLELVCCHFNHGLRKEADDEERFAHGECKKLNIKFAAEKKEVAKFFKGDSLEQTARDLRFDFFLKCSRHFKTKKIALAHHKDDLVETVLMRFIRGSGLKGLKGFLPKSKYKNLTVIRPLIEATKQDIVDFLREQNIAYCIDRSNLEDKFLRNKIRLKLMPLLKQLNPDISENICNLAKIISYDYEYIYSVSRKKFLDLKRWETKNELKLDLAGLKELENSLFNNVILEAIADLKGNTRAIEMRHLRELKDLIFRRPLNSIVDLPYMAVKKEDKCLRFILTGRQ